MCGITGYITKRPTKKVITAFKSLLIANEDRGNESTGIFMNNQLIKSTLKASSFVDKIDNNELLKSTLTLGHTRLATTGDISKDNAHPFTYGNITGVHNGVIQNYQDIYKKAKVDSQAIFYLLNKNKNNYYKTLKQIKGSMAIAWTNADNTLYLMRHNNPLSIAYINDTLFFSSEYYHLYSVLYAVYGNTTKLVIELEEDKVYTITDNLKTTDQKIKVKEDVYYNYYINDNKNTEKYIQDDTIDRDTLYKGQNNKAIFQDLADFEGCAKCGSFISEGYLDSENYYIYCQDCIADVFDNKTELEYIKLTEDDQSLYDNI